MSSHSESGSPLPHPRIPVDLIVAAAERRSQQDESRASADQLMRDHEQRQKFRRLIDPGILRPNSKEVAFASLKTLSMIAENLLREPDNSKYQQFKRTNNTIRQRLIEPKGALEYAIELGFRAEIQNFQPLYVFNPKKMTELRIGASILKEAVELETQKQERTERAMIEKKAADEAVVQNVKLAIWDDRTRKMAHDQKEREQREAQALRDIADANASPSRRSQISSPSPDSDVEIVGMSAQGNIGINTDDVPPPYHN